jgi:hypothetical protein
LPFWWASGGDKIADSGRYLNDDFGNEKKNLLLPRGLKFMLILQVQFIDFMEILNVNFNELEN